MMDMCLAQEKESGKLLGKVCKICAHKFKEIVKATNLR